METDEELVAKIQEGDVSAFEILVKKYQKPFLSFVFKIVQDNLIVEDIVQEAFFKIYKNIHRIDVKKKFSTYGFEVIKNTAISYLRKRKKQISINEMEILVEEDNYENLVKEHQKSLVSRALSQIERKYRDIIGFYYFEELSYKEIAYRMNLPINTIRTRLKRGKSYLKKVLEKNV